MGWDKVRQRMVRHGVWLLLLAGLGACGDGERATESNSGTDKTYLRVEAADADGDALSYSWRVTGGTIENRNSRETVWSLPAGPGLHFAYVLVTDGRGGQVQYQYAVSSDGLSGAAAPRAAVNNPTPTVTLADENTRGTHRVRVAAAGQLMFARGGQSFERRVYLPDIEVQARDTMSTDVVTGLTDLGGEVVLTGLTIGHIYDLECRTLQGVVLDGCDQITGADISGASAPSLVPPSSRNLRLHGHVSLRDGGVCGGQDDFFAVQNAATVQLLMSDGTVMSPVVRVNRFGDYALDAAVPLNASLQLRVRCDGYSALVNVTRPGGGYVAGTQIEATHEVPNTRPQVLRIVATGPEGNVRGQMVQPLTGAHSNGLPGAAQFLSYKGLDSKLSACMYYRAFGAVADCDAQGNMVSPVTLDDWKRRNRFAPYTNGNTEFSATYINERDLNLVRRMVATRVGNDVAFVVCNHPGPEGLSQREADRAIDTALANEKMVACVAMEYTVTPGRNGDLPFTKFLTFGPDGALLSSVNLDGRGEKYLPGACVACHGGAGYSGRFPDAGNPSPDLKAKFLPFDTGNYVFSSSRPGLSEMAQSVAIRDLNQLVLQTNPSPATQTLVTQWYAGNATTLNTRYVPPAWDTSFSLGSGSTAVSVSLDESRRFYREVVATSCRTCHVVMSSSFNWDAGAGAAPLLGLYRNARHVCGGSPDVHSNASMPNALISVDRLQVSVGGDPTLEALMAKVLGCSEARPDPAYPKR